MLFVDVLCCCSLCSIANLSNKFFLRPIPSSLPFTSVLGGGCCCFMGADDGGVVVGIGFDWLLLLTVVLGSRFGSVGS